jgi:hypothetical protein
MTCHGPGSPKCSVLNPDIHQPCGFCGSCCDCAIETSICVECGSDTLMNGFVNRVSFGSTLLDAWICGRCEEAWGELESECVCDKCEATAGTPSGVYGECEWASLREFPEGYSYEQYEAERFAEIDSEFPDAPRFRELANIVRQFDDQGSDADLVVDAAVTELRMLVKNYRRTRSRTS